MGRVRNGRGTDEMTLRGGRCTLTRSTKPLFYGLAQARRLFDSFLGPENYINTHRSGLSVKVRVVHADVLVVRLKTWTLSCGDRTNGSGLSISPQDSLSKEHLTGWLQHKSTAHAMPKTPSPCSDGHSCLAVLHVTSYVISVPYSTAAHSPPRDVNLSHEDGCHKK